MNQSDAKVARLADKMPRVDVQDGLVDTSNLTLAESQREEVVHASSQSQHYFSCTQQSRGITEETQDLEIYKWVDENGVPQFSQRKPKLHRFDTVDLSRFGTAKDYFELSTLFPSGDIAPSIKNDVSIGGRSIYKVYASFVEDSKLSKSRIEILIHKQNEAYQAYRNKIATDIPKSVNGFYSWKHNQAVINHSGNLQTTKRVALHEASHVINAKNFGVMPKWFNEGSAEYFEFISVAGQQITVDPNHYWLRHLGNRYPLLPLSKLLPSSHLQWNSSDRNAYYANAWALVYYLMQPEFRELMTQFQYTLIDNFCSQTDSVAFFESHYPGGVRSLEEDLHSWLRRATILPNRH